MGVIRFLFTAQSGPCLFAVSFTSLGSLGLLGFSPLTSVSRFSFPRPTIRYPHFECILLMCQTSSTVINVKGVTALCLRPHSVPSLLLTVVHKCLKHTYPRFKPQHQELVGKTSDIMELYLAKQQSDLFLL